MKITKQRLKEIIKEELNEITFFGKDIGPGGVGNNISKEDLIEAGFSRDAVNGGFLNRVITYLDNVRPKQRALQALKAVGSKQPTPATATNIIKALKEELKR